MAFAPSSVIVTGATVDTRARDELSFSFIARPQALTIYVRLIMLTTDAGTSGNRVVVQIGSSSTTNPRLLMDFLTSTWRLILLNGINSVSSTVANTGITAGDRIELLGTVQSTGVVQISWTRNGGTITTGTASGALTLPSAWTNNVLMVNSVSGGGSPGFGAYRNIFVVAGVRTMQEMRVLAGTD